MVVDGDVLIGAQGCRVGSWYLVAWSRGGKLGVCLLKGEVLGEIPM